MPLPPYLPRFVLGVFFGLSVGLPARAQETLVRINPLTGEAVVPLGGEASLFDEFSQDFDTLPQPLRGDVSPAAALVLDPPLGGSVAVGAGVLGNNGRVPAGQPAPGAPTGPGADAGPGVPVNSGDFDETLVDIRQRRRRELEPLGIRAGGFTLYPQVGTRAVFTDNVTRALADKKSDMLYAVSPALRVESNWGRHALSFQYSGDYGAYLETASEKVESTNFAAQAQVDFSRADRLTLRASFASDLEERDNVDVTAAVLRPGTVMRYDARGDYQHRFNRATATLRGNYGVEKYGDSQIATSTQDNSDRDFTDAGTGLRLSYDVSPGLRVFADGQIDRRTYISVPAGDIDRTSTGWRGAVGLRFDPARRLRGEVSAGYLRRTYRDTRLLPVDGLVVDASLAWLATPLTTIVGSAGSEVEETTLAGSSGLFTRRFGLGVAHELRRNIIVSADLGYEHQSYEGLSRSNSKVVVTLGGTYQISRNAALTLTGVYEDELSAKGEGQYLENTLTLGLVLRR